MSGGARDDIDVNDRAVLMLVDDDRVALAGVAEHLLRDSTSGTTETVPAGGLFVLIAPTRTPSGSRRRSPVTARATS